MEQNPFSVNQAEREAPSALLSPEEVSRYVEMIKEGKYKKLKILLPEQKKFLKQQEGVQTALRQAMRYALENQEMSEYLDSVGSDRTCFQELLVLNLHDFDITQEPWLQPALRQAMRYALENRSTYGLKKLLNLNLHDFDITQEPWLQPALQQGMQSSLEWRDINDFRKLKNLNLHTEATLTSAIESVIVDNQALFSIIEQSIPGFTEKARTSLSVLISTISLRQYDLNTIAQTFTKAPHLARVMEHEYGARLVAQYIGFDRLSQQNIDTLLTVQSEHPQDGTAYRLDVQDTLKDYERNTQILHAIQEKGISVDTWLNWDKEEYFVLGKEEVRATTLLLENPIKRTRESFEAIAKSIKDNLKEYKGELVEKKVTEDTTEIQKQLESQKEALVQAQAEGNEKKIQGIQKGIANTQARLASPKQVPAWDKATGDMSALLRLVENISQAQVVLKQAEEMQVTDASSRVDRKQAIKKAEAQIEQITQTLKIRYRTLFENLTNILHVLGEDRAKGIVDDIRRELGETFSHLETDFGEFERVFTKDENVTSLTGRPMRIRLASRAPQDLYIGNYTDCCVAIDNVHHGSESPISDYLTDLGMQIAIIEDEQEEMPVAAAWLFLGTDGKQQALVVDNIEGRGAYSSVYKKQLEEKLKKYLNAYAEDLRLPLAQGDSNNDLVVVPKTKNDVYVKLGGANRADGIFLEAEADSEDDEDEDTEENVEETNYEWEDGVEQEVYEWEANNEEYDAEETLTEQQLQTLQDQEEDMVPLTEGEMIQNKYEGGRGDTPSIQTQEDMFPEGADQETVGNYLRNQDMNGSVTLKDTLDLVQKTNRKM